MINNDGLHFDGCRHVRVGGCEIRTGDDCIIMRANRMPGGMSLCEDLIVSNCTLNSNCQAIRLGCPSDDTIRNGLFKNLRISGNNGIASIHPVRYLQPNCGGYCRMENLRFEDCTVDVRGVAVFFTVDPGIRLRAFGNVTFDGLVLGRESKIVLNGSEDSPLVNMDFENVTRVGGRVPLVRGKSDSWEAD
jgi:polygalacturonase